MNITNQSISSTINNLEINRSKNNNNNFDKKFDGIKKDWAFEEGSNVEQAYMGLQKRRFDKKSKKDKDWNKMTADQKLNIFKRLKNNNVPVPVKK